MTETLILYIMAMLYTCLSIQLVQKVKHIHNGRELRKASSIINAIIVFFPVIFIYGFRADVGVDYKTYLMYFNYYRRYVSSFHDIITQRLEPGYVVLNKIAEYFSSNQYSIFLICGIIIFGLLYIIITQYKTYINASLTIYIFLMCYFGASCNIVRQTIAMMFITVGYKSLIKKKYITFIEICLVAFLFHKSAIVCILFILFDKIYDAIKGKIKWIVIIGSELLLLFGNYFINAIHSLDWFKDNYNRNGFNINAFLFLLYVIPEIVFIEYNKRKLLEKNERYNLLISLFYMQIPFQLMDIYSSAIQRISIYFSVLKIILIPAIVGSYRSTRKYMVNIIIVLLWYLLFFIMTEILLTGNGLFPYKFFQF